MTTTFTCSYEIPFHEKEFDFTCGASALRMAIHALTGNDFTEAFIARILGTSPKVGSPLKLFEQNLDRVLKEVHKKTSFELEWIINQNGAFEQLKELLIKKYIVLLNHKKLSGGSHWAILRSINVHDITLIDPEFGPQKTYTLDKFDWQGGTTIITTKAYVAIRLRGIEGVPRFKN